MARMHSRARGKSGSTKPSKPVIPSWLKYKPKEVELLIVKYAKEGKTTSQIGTHLRDVYGIPDVQLITKKKINEILKEKNLQADIPEDLTALIKKSIKIRKHLEENKHDYTAKRGLQLTDSKINRLVKYYKANKRLPAKWVYDPAKVRLQVS
ncbi:MAG: 30S ribosomal protein S15 [Candidatus Woesearchaeota archaeon]